MAELPAVEADASAVTASGAVPLAGLTLSLAVGPTGRRPAGTHRHPGRHTTRRAGA